MRVFKKNQDLKAAFSPVLMPGSNFHNFKDCANIAGSIERGTNEANLRKDYPVIRQD